MKQPVELKKKKAKLVIANLKNDDSLISMDIRENYRRAQEYYKKREYEDARNIYEEVINQAETYLLEKSKRPKANLIGLDRLVDALDDSRNKLIGIIAHENRNCKYLQRLGLEIEIEDNRKILVYLKKLDTDELIHLLDQLTSGRRIDGGILGRINGLLKQNERIRKEINGDNRESFIHEVYNINARICNLYSKYFNLTPQSKS